MPTTLPVAPPPGADLKQLLHSRCVDADPQLVVDEGEGSVRCVACGHRCLLRVGRDGICKVRYNDNGKLKVPFGYVAGVAVDPVEKKPFFHTVPGSGALTFGMLGCDYHCGYCQNWVTSQMLRDPKAVAPLRETDAPTLVQLAVQNKAKIVVSSYNEPLITAEWAAAVFKPARAAGLKTAYVSNGNATPEALDFIGPLVDAYKVDLKAFNDRAYRELGGLLDHVLSTIRMLKQRGLWVEIVTLLVPGFSDDRDELKRMAEFLADVDPLMPWHVTAFHPDYKMIELRRTQVDDLLSACEIGRAAGLKYIYAGNLPGHVGEWENTRCHKCNTTLIERRGFHVLRNDVGMDGWCPQCGAGVPGVWA